MIEGMWLNKRWVSADHPDADPFIAKELERQRAAKERAKEYGLEVLTPQAAMSLFGISAPAVRQARLGGHVLTRLILEITDKSVHLLDLASAIDYWQDKKREDFDATLEDMRENGHPMGVGSSVYNVLHVKPIVRMDAADIL